jgi:hypothetical protein
MVIIVIIAIIVKMVIENYQKYLFLLWRWDGLGWVEAIQNLTCSNQKDHRGVMKLFFMLTLPF